MRVTPALRPLLLTGLAVATLSLPVTAQARDRSIDREAARVAEMANDPAVQQRLARGMEAVLAALMQVKVGPLARAAEEIDPESRMADMDPDTTIGDLAGARDPHYRERMADGMDRTARSMGTLAAALATMLPSLADAAEDIEAQMGRVRRN